MSREGIRNRFRPEVTRLLLVGESPPANRTFFYSANSKLNVHTFAAFARLGLVSENPTVFLDTFRGLGCYLDDLCHSPVNNLPTPARRAERNRSVPGLALRLQKIRPEVVVCVMRAGEPAVRCALAAAGMHEIPFHSLPFPAQDHQREYVEGLAQLVSRLGIVPSV